MRWWHKGQGRAKYHLQPLAQDDKGGFGHTLNKLNPLCLALFRSAYDRALGLREGETARNYTVGDEVSFIKCSEMTFKTLKKSKLLLGDQE